MINNQNKALWIFPNFLETINELPEKQRADVWRAVCEYGLGCEIDIEKLKTTQKMAIKMLIPLLKLRNTGGSIKQGEIRNKTGNNQFSQLSDCNSIKQEEKGYPNPLEIPLENPLITRNRKRNNNIIPSKEEVINYALSRNRLDLANTFYDYYTAGNWQGIKNWKQKFITWESHNEKPKENKVFIDNELRAKL